MTRGQLIGLIVAAIVLWFGITVWPGPQIASSWQQNQATTNAQATQTAQAQATETTRAIADDNRRPTATAGTTRYVDEECLDKELHADDVAYMPDCLTAKGDVEVSNSNNGPWTRMYDDVGSTGVLLSCPDGCWIRAPFGANLSPRSIDDLENEMRRTGCEDHRGCEKVERKTWPIEDKPVADHTPAPTPAVSSPPQDNCDDFSLDRDEVRLVPAGMIVDGDVDAAVSADGPWVWTTDSRQNSGAIIVAKTDIYIRAPYEASVYCSTTNIDSIIASKKSSGCATGCKEVHVKDVANKNGTVVLTNR